MLLVGPVLMLIRMWPQRLSRQGMVRLAWIGFGLVTVSSVLAVWLQAPYSSGDSLSDVDSTGCSRCWAARSGSPTWSGSGC